MQVPGDVRLAPGDGSIAWRGDVRYFATNTRAGPGTQGNTRLHAGVLPAAIRYKQLLLPAKLA